MGVFRDFAGVPANIFDHMVSWLSIVVVSIACLTPDICIEYIRRSRNPTPVDIVRELEIKGESEVDRILTEIETKANARKGQC